MTDRTFATTYRELAEALGLAAVSRAHELAKEPWFPPKGAEGWDVDECRLRLARKRAGKPPVPEPDGGAGAPSAPRFSDNPLVAARERGALPPELTDEDRELLQVLRTSTDEVALVRATMVLMSRRLGNALAAQALPAKSLEDFSIALDGLRKTEAAVLELGKDRGDWIERDVARVLVGQVSRSFVEALDRLIMRIAQQVDVWLADPDHRALAVDERTRKVRAWAHDQTRALRAAEAGPAARAELDRRIDAEIAEQRA